jgi:hypothetical protein
MARKLKGDYEVGFGRPPQHSRFRAGHSGNPKGRPKGAKNLETLLAEALNEKVVVKEDGRRRAITKREIIIKQLVNKSAGADLQAIRMLLGVTQGFKSAAVDVDDSEAGDQPLSEADRQVMEELSRRLLRPEEDGDA